MIEQGGIQFLSLKGNSDFVGFNVTDESGNSMTVKLSLEQLKILTLEGANILNKKDVNGVGRTQYSNGDVQFHINDF